MKKISLIFVFILLSVFCSSVSSVAEIYRCVDENGERTYTTKSGTNCVLLTGSVEKKSKTTTTSIETTETSTEFEQVGYYKNKKMRGFTYYVKNPIKEQIRRFCVKMVRRYQEGRNRILKIHFFDNKNYTPDVTLRYYFSESSDKYLIGDFFDNPFNNESGLTFHKDIGE